MLGQAWTDVDDSRRLWNTLSRLCHWALPIGHVQPRCEATRCNARSWSLESDSQGLASHETMNMISGRLLSGVRLYQARERCSAARPRCYHPAAGTLYSAWRFCGLAFADNLGFHAPNPAELPFILDELPLVRKALERASL